MNERIQHTLENLKKKKFIPAYFETAQEAKQAVLELVKDGTVGIGGSMTVKEMGLYEALLEQGNQVYCHTYNPQEPNVYQKAQYADYYISSANALTEDGCIMNMDGMGNRVSALAFGPGKLVILAGVNKLVPDIAAGIARIKGHAAGLNARRLNRHTPCSVDLKCRECSPPVRICRSLHVMEAPPLSAQAVYVYLIGEELGF